MRAQGGEWEPIAPIPTARQEVSTAVLNGKVYVIGGYDENLNSTATVEVYNSATNSWSTARPLPLATNHNSAAAVGGKIYAFGGGGNRTFACDPASDEWLTVAPTKFQHGGTAAVGVIGDKIYVAGGVSGTTSLTALEVYDPRRIPGRLLRR